MLCRLFDQKELAVHDGQGLRLTLFFKGCPLHCIWCHNPEGISPEKQLVKNSSLCKHCGLCKQSCEHDECKKLGLCTRICPENLIRVSGMDIDTDELAKKILSFRAFYKKDGGVTFSGGESLLQYQAIIDIIDKIETINTCIETSGYADTTVFLNVLSKINQIYIDIKLMDETEHIKYTGVSNRLILHNIKMLADLNKPFTVRVPLIPDITDTETNLTQIASFLEPFGNLVSVELLPYNKLTGAKYRTIGQDFNPPFEQEKELNANTEPFTDRKITVKILK